jgi:hypothetical protein
MIIELDEQAKRWIESKGNHLTVKNVEVKGCCFVGVQELVAIPKKPKALERYNQYKVDTLSIYVHKNINSDEKIHLKLSGIGLLKSISANVSAII